MAFYGFHMIYSAGRDRGTRRKEPQGGRKEEEERGTRKKEGRGGRSNEDERAMRRLKNEKL
jgi:hypothetical protein